MTENGIFRLSRLTKLIDNTAIIEYWIYPNRRIYHAIHINTTFYKSCINTIDTPCL